MPPLAVLLTISTTHSPATDIGFLLHKNPSVVFSTEMTFGQAVVFYPEATEEKCTVALVLEVDPIRLVRGSADAKESGFFDQYVNDRPYAASSFLSTGIVTCFRTAMTGKSKERPELAEMEIPLEAEIPVLPSRGGEKLLRGLFEPLGYEVETSRLPLDPRFPEWGESPYYALRLKGTKRLKDLARSGSQVTR